MNAGIDVSNDHNTKHNRNWTKPSKFCPTFSHSKIETLRGRVDESLGKLSHHGRVHSKQRLSLHHCEWCWSIATSLRVMLIHRYITVLDVDPSLHHWAWCWSIATSLWVMLIHRYITARDVDPSLHHWAWCWSIATSLRVMLIHRHITASDVDPSLHHCE